MPPPQIPLTGNIGPQGNFPLLNSINIVISDSDYTMAYPDMSASILRITSSATLTDVRSIIAPLSFGFEFAVQNMTTGNQALIFRGATGDGVVIPHSQSVFLFCDGNNYVTASSSTPMLLTTGTLPLPVPAGVTAFDKTRIVSIGEAATPTVPGRLTLAGDSSDDTNYVPYLDIYGPGGNAAIFGVPVKAGTIDAQTYLQNGLPFAGGGGGGSGLANLGVPNAVGDGTTNDAAAFNAVTAKEIWLPSGKNYFIGSNVTINYDLRFIDGAQLIIGNGATVQINGHMTAPFTQCFVFQGTGALNLGNKNWEVPAEWFGAVGDGTYNGSIYVGTDNTAALQKCLDSIQAGQMLLQAQFYMCQGTLTITQRQYIGIRGTVSGQGPSHLITDSPSSTIVSVIGYSSNSPMWGHFERFAVTRNVAGTSTSVGFSMDMASGYIMDRVYSFESGRCFYFRQSGSSGTGQIHRCTAGWGRANAGPLYGYYLDTVGSSITAGLYSIRIADCFCWAPPPLYSTQTWGIYLIGNIICDVMVDRFESTGCFIGVGVYPTDPRGFVNADTDVHFRDHIHDMVKGKGFDINGLLTSAAGACTIEGGWITPDVVNTIGITIQSCNGVTVQGVQILNGAGSMYTGIYVSESSDISLVNNNIIAGVWSGIQINNSSYCSVVSNVIRSRISTAFYLLLSTNTTRCSLMSNVAHGPGGIGLQLQAQTGNNIVVGTTLINGQTTRVIDSGASNSIDGVGGGGGTVTPPTPIESWVMGDGSGTTAANSYNSGNPLTFNGGVAWTTQVSFPGLSVARFDGTGIATAASGATTNFDGPFSVVCTVYLDSVEPVNQTFVGNLDVANGNRGWYIQATLASITAYLVSDQGSNNMINLSSTLPTQLNNTGPHFIAMTYDGSKTASGLNIYLNGVSITRSVLVDNLTGSMASTIPVSIGAVPGSPLVNPFSGIIRAVSIWNVALTLPEIIALM